MHEIQINVADGKIKVRQKSYSGTNSISGSERTYNDINDLFDYIIERIRGEVDGQLKHLDKSRAAWSELLDGLDSQKAI